MRNALHLWIPMPEPLSPSPFVQQSIGIGGVPLDWLYALLRLQQGRVSDPSEDKLYANTTQPWQWGRTETGELAGETQGGLLGMRPRWVPDAPSGSSQAIPFGDVSDPVSQLAFVLAPYIRAALPELAATVGLGGPAGPLGSRGILTNERGMMARSRAAQEYGPETVETLKKYMISKRPVPSSTASEEGESTVASRFAEGFQARAIEGDVAPGAYNLALQSRTYAPKGYATHLEASPSDPLMIMSNFVKSFGERFPAKPGTPIPENAILPTQLTLPRSVPIEGVSGGQSGVSNVPALAVGRSVRTGTPEYGQFDRSLFVVPDSDDFAIVMSQAPVRTSGNPMQNAVDGWEILSRHATLGEAIARGQYMHQRLLQTIKPTTSMPIRLPRQQQSGGGGIYPFQ